jgi:uncharacterized protein (DUF488 family)
MALEIWTVGHSTRDLGAFVECLLGPAIAVVADVRRFPGSRRHPQYDAAALAEALRRAGIAYRHFGDLGGRRGRRAPGSPNTAWRVEAFNAFADHMATPAFESALAELIACADGAPTAVMCAEAMPWRCHRRLIADALSVRGWTVRDILGPGQIKPHSLTAFARVANGRISYPAELVGGDRQSDPGAP